MLNDFDTIYHYCSVETFLEIIKTNTLWLSHAQTTHDINEDKNFIKCMRHVQQKYSEHTFEELEIIASIIKEYEKKLYYPYICCFSKNKDLLNQWRYYADDCKGVAIGFDFSKFKYFDLMMEKNDDESVVQIDEVDYSENNDELIFKFFESALLLYRQTKEKNRIIHNTLKLINMLSIFSKKKCFEDEQEVRIVYRPCSRYLVSGFEKPPENLHNFFNSSHFKINFRHRNSEIISYFTFPFEKDCIKEIVLGPNCKIEYLQLVLLLSQYAPRPRIENRITHSNIEYR